MTRSDLPYPRPTSLIFCRELARDAGVAAVFIKAEDERPLGNFKSTAGYTAALKALVRYASTVDVEGPATSLRLLCASDGNHGLAVATAARDADVPARVFLPASISGWRRDRIARTGAEIIQVDGTYDNAVSLAREAAGRGDGILIADTSDRLDDPAVIDVMTGYAATGREIGSQFAALGSAPTHAFIQAGVGGFAAAIGGASALRFPDVRVVVVEPEVAACVAAGLATGRPVQICGDLSSRAEMLACGLASAPAILQLKALNVLSVTVSETELDRAPALAAAYRGRPTTPSGGAGLAGLLSAAASGPERLRLGLGSDSVVLLFITEGDEQTQQAM